VPRKHLPVAKLVARIGAGVWSKLSVLAARGTFNFVSPILLEEGSNKKPVWKARCGRHDMERSI